MQFIRQNLGTCQITAIFRRNPTKPSPAITPAKSHASRERLTHFRWVSRSHSAQWKSHAFSCSTKSNIFNITSVLLLWWEMRVLTPVLLLLTLGLLIFMCGSTRHTHSDSVPAPNSSIVNDCASVDSFFAAYRHNLRPVELCPFSIHGVGNTDIVYVRASC